MDKEYYSIYSWRSMAEEDLNVAKNETVPLFIRAFHAQQSIEKMLKAAFIITVGDFDAENKGWALPEDIEFPKTHDLSKLWEKLSDCKVNDFPKLNHQQKIFLDNISECAVKYRYPYFLSKADTVVVYPDLDVKNLVDYSTLIYNDLYHYICTHSY